MAKVKGKTAGLHIAVEPSMRKDLERIAEVKGFSISVLVRSVLLEYLRTNERSRVSNS